MSLVGKQLGHYIIAQEVGTGGLGKVFRAVDQRDGKSVAIKFLHDKYTANRKFLGIFHRELLIISRLHHKHIVSYLDSGFEPPHCYIVTEYVAGWSIYSFLKRVKHVPPLVALSVVIDMLSGIDYLHLHDTIHADLSSANVLIDASGRVLVTDFGLAAQRDIEDYKNYMVGTPGYYSPEHVSEEAISPASDIYCAGIILFELITGVKPVPALTDRNKIISYMKKIPIKELKCSDKTMEKMLRMLCVKALEFHASKRIQAADHMMFECYTILKRYNIRFARHAIKKFLIDQNLAPGPYRGKAQDIYIGT